MTEPTPIHSDSPNATSAASRAGANAAGPGDTRSGDDVTKRQIPGYQILEKLGAGAMAVVFKAKQLSLDRIVAIKVLPKKLSADTEFVERFYAEGQAAAKLNHPNIVQAIDVNEVNGYHYFVMEYVEGKTVYEELESGKVYTEAEALGIAIQITHALLHAHAQGLIHRDVKPKNLMMTQDGTAKLMDMGLARVADDAQAIQAEVGRLFGTPYYISPEQIVGMKDLDFRCDIYSLGATLYHMVTGQVPFEGEDSKEVMVKHCKQPLVAPDRLNLDLSFGFVKLIQKMMCKRRENRHASTQELLEDLQSVDFLLEVENPGQAMVRPDLGQHAVPPQAATAVSPSPVPQPVAAPRPMALPLAPDRSKTVLLVGLILSTLLNLVLLFLLVMR